MRTAAAITILAGSVAAAGMLPVPGSSIVGVFLTLAGAGVLWVQASGMERALRGADAGLAELIRVDTLGVATFREDGARDGVEALELLHGPDGLTELPALVLLDLKLPRVDGVKVLRAIRGNERTRFLPTVVLTSSREERDLIETYKLGVNSYVVKPVDFDQFVDVPREIGLYWLLLNNRPPAAIA